MTGAVTAQLHRGFALSAGNIKVLRRRIVVLIIANPFSGIALNSIPFLEIF
jgi:hypothetical protein